MDTRGVIYQYKKKSFRISKVGVALVAFALGGIVGPMAPALRLETAYAVKRATEAKLAVLPPSVPVVFDPVNRDFSLIIPKIGVNAAVIPSVNPANTKEYLDILKTGIAHASTSFVPGEGTTYLFSHSTNYDWFAKDLNAVFYHLKNLTEGDTIVVFYKGKQFTYRLTEKRIVKPSEISYLVGVAGDKRLILQTCWPPGSTTERLLIFAELIVVDSSTIL